ncbi:hypothetical protein OPV22_018948 [Ensete ventricosum]|uniref:Uncharacterized protein n=1 Tax=Ensete ventricosum TaxID=4639 RepID=A0AAV8R0N9_ENSVE|nr:hypothetical protein OPV22_018948 [Ensete ventricosum]
MSCPSMEHPTPMAIITSILVAALLVSPSHLRQVPVHHLPSTGGDGEVSTQGFVSLAREPLLTPPSPTSNMSPPGGPSR